MTKTEKARELNRKTQTHRRAQLKALAIAKGYTGWQDYETHVIRLQTTIEDKPR